MSDRVPKKLIMIGLDGASARIVKYWLDRGFMPHTAELIQRGVFGELLPGFPTNTPPNWTTIVTGATTGSHSITEFFYHEPGDSLDRVRLGLDTNASKCEYLWDAAERVGKRSILVKFEASWPPTHKTGIQIEGLGPGGTSYFELSGSRLYTLADWPLVDRIELKPCRGWQNLPESTAPRLETELVIKVTTGALDEEEIHQRRLVRSAYREAEDKVLHLLVFASGVGGYDRVLVARSKDAADCLAELGVGEWSDWSFEGFPVDGGSIQGAIRFKLLRLTPDAGELELFLPQVFPTTGYHFPASIGQRLNREVGPFLQNPGRTARSRRWIDDDTFFELVDYHHEWLAKAVNYLTSKEKWDLCFLETHVPDYLSHQYLHLVDPISGAEVEQREEAHNNMARGYASVDSMIGDVLKAASEETLVTLVSDHGGAAGPGRLQINRILSDLGFIAYEERAETGRPTIDWTRTKAFPTGRHIWVNLKGRDPDGAIEPGEEYEKVREEILEALSRYRDPRTGKQVFSLALKREDACILGMGGERTGDLVWAYYTPFDGAHGCQLPGTIYGIGSMRSVFIMAGPGVKKGHQLRQHAWLTSVTPTIAHLLRLPMPRGAEGAILYDALEHPDAWLKEIERLAEERDRWKAAYQSYSELTHVG